MTEPKGQTLAELDVQPGDVVLYDGSKGGEAVLRTFAGIKDGRWYNTEQEFGGAASMNATADCWHLIRRANPTRSQLIAQRDALDAQIAAMPETVLVHWSMQTGFTNFHYGQSTHYRDFPIGPDGVPEGFVEVSK